MPTGISPCTFRIRISARVEIAAQVMFLIVAGLLCACGERTKNSREAADEFFKLVSAQKFTEAYERASGAFRYTRSARYFEARARDLGLADAPDVEWGQPEQQGRLTKIRGVFTRKDGSTLALNLALILENGEWRLDEAASDPSPTGGVVDDVFAVTARSRDSVKYRVAEFLEPSAFVVPPEREMRRLVEETLLKFNDAILNAGDFSSLYADASDRWKYRGRDPRELAYSGTDPARAREADPFNNENRLTTAALKNAFAAAIEAKVDLSGIKGANMILGEPPRINSDGVLKLDGSFDCSVFQLGEPGKPRRLFFQLEYVMEASKWKLFGITVHILAGDKRPEQLAR